MSTTSACRTASSWWSRLRQRGFARFRCYDPALGHSRYAELPESLAQADVEATDRLEPALFSGAQVVVVAHRHQSIVAAGESPGLRQAARAGGAAMLRVRRLGRVACRSRAGRRVLRVAGLVRRP